MSLDNQDYSIDGAFGRQGVKEDGEETMKCQRCHGLLVLDTFYGLLNDRGPLRFSGLRCVSCGNVLDPLIARHQHVAMKGIESEHQGSGRNSCMASIQSHRNQVVPSSSDRLISREYLAAALSPRRMEMAGTGSMSVGSVARDRYELSLEPARVKFAGSRTLSSILAPGIDPVLLELFLISCASLGVTMTEPVEDWIRKAGEGCEQFGLRELGRALRRHSNQEAGHDLMLIKDSRALVHRWNARHSFAPNTDFMIGQRMSEGVRAYRKLHEEVIAGDSPFCQVAIEYEIEGLSVRLGPQFIEQCMDVLGSTVTASLSFLTHHIEQDVGHTRLNNRLLTSLLDEHPEHLKALVSSGQRALQAYSMFLDDCLRLAELQLGRTR